MRLLTLRPALLAAACALTLAGCGNDGGDDGGDAQGSATAGTEVTTSAAPSAASTTPAPTPSEKAKPDLPACEGIWSEGKVLPKSYRGCVDEFGQVSKSIRGCSIGSKLAQHGDQFYAILGREIMRATPTRNQSQDYLDFIEICAG